MCCNDDTTEQVPVNQTVTSNIDPFIKEKVDKYLTAGEGAAMRPFPMYDQARITPHSADTEKSFEMVRDAEGVWRPMMEKAQGYIDGAAAPVSQANIDAYMNPYTDEVVNSTLARINHQAGVDKVARDSALIKRGSFLNEDRRGVIDNMANDATHRLIAETTARLKSAGFSEAMGQANIEKNRGMDAGGRYMAMGPLNSQLSFADAAARAGIGQTQEAKTQQNLDLGYGDFLKQFQYPQEQIQWLMNLLRGAPQQQSQTTQGTQNVALPNTFAQNLGAFGAITGGLGMFADGGGFPKLLGTAAAGA